MQKLKKIILFILCNLVLTACASETDIQGSGDGYNPNLAPTKESTLIQTPPIIMTEEIVNDDFILFAREDDLWRVDINGADVERLSEDKLLNWNMAGDEWRLVARSRPVQILPSWAICSSNSAGKVQSVW